MPGVVEADNQLWEINLSRDFLKKSTIPVRYRYQAAERRC
jgi:hypothetical protein